MAWMTDALAHRGPDGRGVWRESGVGLGHRRLAIRDLSAAGAQPFHSSCGRVVVTYNGEIYNDREIAAELARTHGFIRRTTCDTEILPAGWLSWGLGLFDRLEGIYALALWDRERRQLVLARDGAGVKPLYVADDGTTVRFGSEAKALTADPEFPSALAPAQIASLLALGHVEPEQSLIAGIGQIAPGTARLIDRSGSYMHRFWQPRRRPRIRNLKEACDGFLALFQEVVSDQLVSDVPVAVLQSGGIDSALISLTLPERADVRLYSVRFGDQAFDESRLSAEVARAAGRPIEFLDLGTSDVEGDFQNVVRSVDGGLSDSSALASYRLARSIRRAAPVALSGDGGDEFFAGYATYRATALAALVPRLTRQASGRLAELIAHRGGFTMTRMGSAEAVSRLFLGLSLAVPHVGWRTYLNPWDRTLLYGAALRELADHEPLDAYKRAFREAEGDAWDRGLVADQRHYLPADMLVKVDRTSMAHGLEIRVPFLDRRVMDFAGTLDRSLLATFDGQTKRVLRTAAERLGASRSITRARKRGFNVPMNRILREGLRPLADRLLDREADILAPYCAQDGVRRMWHEHRDGRVDRKYVIWTLLTLAVAREQMGI